MKLNVILNFYFHLLSFSLFASVLEVRVLNHIYNVFCFSFSFQFIIKSMKFLRNSTSFFLYFYFCFGLCGVVAITMFIILILLSTKRKFLCFVSGFRTRIFSLSISIIRSFYRFFLSVFSSSFSASYLGTLTIEMFIIIILHSVLLFFFFIFRL